MPRFKVFHSVLEHMRKHRFIEKKGGYQQAVEKTVQALGMRGVDMQLHLLFVESWWNDLGRPTWFIDGEETVEAVRQLRVDNFDMTTLPSGVWAFIPPYKSPDLDPLLLRVTTTEQYSDASMSLMRSAGMPNGIPTKTPGLRSYLAATMNGNPLVQLGTEHDLASDYDMVMEGRKPRDWQEDDINPTDEESKRVAVSQRFALQCLIYAMVHPEKLRQGPPNMRANPKDKFFAKGQILSGVPELMEGAAVTAVGSFYRQLRDQRYYQGKHAEKPVGSRFVKVKPHVRGSKQPSTLKVG